MALFGMTGRQQSDWLGIWAMSRRSLYSQPNARLNPANTPARIDPHAIIEAYRGTISLPFESGEHRRIAVKSVDDRGGVESLKVAEGE